MLPSLKSQCQIKFKSTQWYGWWTQISNVEHKNHIRDITRKRIDEGDSIDYQINKMHAAQTNDTGTHKSMRGKLSSKRERARKIELVSKGIDHKNEKASSVLIITNNNNNIR